jgi:hypothetical protein
MPAGLEYNSDHMGISAPVEKTDQLGACQKGQMHFSTGTLPWTRIGEFKVIIWKRKRLSEIHDAKHHPLAALVYCCLHYRRRHVPRLHRTPHNGADAALFPMNSTIFLKFLQRLTLRQKSPWDWLSYALKNAESQHQ